MKPDVFRGTPLHIHNLQDEVYHVIEGSYYFQVGDERFNLAKGDSIFLPRQVPHAWTQVSERGKMMVIFQPAGKMEENLKLLYKTKRYNCAGVGL
jgi:quercetin dioxygenase-like cupin family protein